jgi:hypothetical protein
MFVGFTFVSSVNKLDLYEATWFFYSTGHRFITIIAIIEQHVIGTTAGKQLP